MDNLILPPTWLSMPRLRNIEDKAGHLASSILDAVKVDFEIGMHTLCHLEALSLSLHGSS
jgi:hypothetical protein